MDTLYVGSYEPYADVVVLAVVIVMAIAIKNMIIRNNENFRVYWCALLCVMLMAVMGIMDYPIIHDTESFPVWIIYARRLIYYSASLTSLMLFQFYILYLFRFGKQKQRRWTYLFGGVWAIGMIGVILTNTPNNIGFCVKDGKMYSDKSTDLFLYFYILEVIIIMIMLFQYRDRLMNQIRNAIISVAMGCVVIMGIQMYYSVSTFMVMTYLLPMIVVLMLLHSNSYDQETGALDSVSMDNLLRQGKLDQIEFISLKFRDNYTIPSELMRNFYYFQEGYVQKVALFRIQGNRMVLAFKKKLDSDANIIRLLNEQFGVHYEKYKVAYKIVWMQDITFLKNSEEFLNNVLYYERMMNDNEFKRVTEKDIVVYKEARYILSELEDITDKMDLDDPRVLVYCQPIQNVATKEFDTAETLMRLKLDKMPFVTPDRFISLAESYNLIHGLSMIMLNKACKGVHQLEEDGYFIRRVSINFSTIELHGVHFCEDVLQIVERNCVAYEKIAVEITESQSDQDYEMIKERVCILREKGMKIYLDDFGSGYSNIDRILGLNFDVIKFDRSLLLFADQLDRGNTVLAYFAGMLYSLGYTLLFEGVETEKQEILCKENKADYLQGFRYSKPIPFEELSQYLSKQVVG